MPREGSEPRLTELVGGREERGKGSNDGDVTLCASRLLGGQFCLLSYSDVKIAKGNGLPALVLLPRGEVKKLGGLCPGF